jgi:hypothetical protein
MVRIEAVFCSVGHADHHSSRYIRPPAEAFGRSEVRLALRMATAFCLAWDEMGRPWALRGSGTYGSRQREAAKHRCLYLSFHVNSTKEGTEFLDPYALVAHKDAKLEARAVAMALLGDVRVRAVPTPYAPNADSLLSQTGGPAILIEAGFIDRAEHAHLWEADGPERIGRAVAKQLGALS